MFSIWEHRYSYGICFGTVYALQNSTPNISTPNILSIFFSVHTRRVEIGHILCIPSGFYIYIYLPTKLGDFVRANVGKCWCAYSSTMVRIWGILIFPPINPTVDQVINLAIDSGLHLQKESQI